jgi:NitT/TauT family transport system substrate-binding protein
VDVASDKGWFREAGLNVERVDVNGKYFEAMHDVNSGQLHAMGFSQYDLVRHVAAGNDLVGIIAIDYSETAEALIARPGIRRLRDLRGKKIALYRGTYLEYLLSVVAQRDDLDLQEITLVNRAGDDATADFMAGRVDAVLAWEPYVTDAKQAGGVQIFSAGDFPGLTYSVFTLRRDFIEAHPREVDALVKVWQRTERFIRENPQESCVIVARLNHEPLPYVEALLRSDRVLDITDNRRAFSYAAGFESLHGSWRRMNDFMLDHGLVSRRVDSPAHLDSRFIRALK